MASTPDSPFRDVKISTSLGPAPAWLVENDSNGWAIHVHGQGSDRSQTLRGVTSATALGLNSLIVSYRNDGDGPRSTDGLSHLGESEWHDLEGALHFVAERGATRCIIFGWSLGATIALNVLQRSGLSSLVTGIVMVSPVLSWQAVLRANANHQGWPRILGTYVTSLLGLKGISRAAGLSEPLRIRKADAARLSTPLRTPVLILHNKNDWSVPFQISREFAQRQGPRVELVEFDCSGHTQEWNSDPIGWDLAVRRWYGGFLQPERAGDKAEATAGEL
ncbi:lysophospholipase [Paenarthrobacter sp. MMS21-TAE1-1]|uniref:Lysophospholipase n=1 Tax=Paenarthrobacter aromaticivorans TaxID=2849150 RepID=A0ABS6I820_9MICC|nr:lysophospholipase [Paenarthrobacter sp. MMS21-TAE1-1]